MANRQKSVLKSEIQKSLKAAIRNNKRLAQKTKKQLSRLSAKLGSASEREILKNGNRNRINKNIKLGNGVSAKLNIKRLNNNELMDFLRNKVESESDFIDTINANGRSLCLMQAKTVTPQITSWDGVDKPKVKFYGSKFDLNNPKTKYNDYIVKDCKWSHLILQKVQTPIFNEIYFCIGLATPTRYDGIEYPQMIGLHTKPEVAWPLEYPD